MAGYPERVLKIGFALKLLLLGLTLFALLNAPASAQTLVEFDERADSEESCVELLGEFGSVCSEFLPSDVEEFYGYSFWEGSFIEVARHDLDGDGLADAVVRPRHTFWCGTRGCSNSFFFGGDQTNNFEFRYSISSHVDFLLVEQDGIRGIVYQGSTHFFPIEEIKSKSQR